MPWCFLEGRGQVMAKCKFCESKEHYRNGIVRGHQRYKCKDCGRNFTQTAIRGVCPKDKLKALMLYASGLSMNRIAQLFGVSTVAVLKWIRALGLTLCPKIEPSGDEQVLVMEVDEFWHFLKKRKISCGFSKPMIVIDKDSSTGKSVIVLIKPSNVCMRG